MTSLPMHEAGAGEQIRVLETDDAAEWCAVLAAVDRHDVYHLPEYHRLAESAGEGRARLFVYRAGDCTIALPLLLREVNAVAGLTDVGTGWMDATSVYGYPGPIASHPHPDPAHVARFQEALWRWLREARVVSLFSRLHPLLEQKHLLAGLGERVSSGETVSIDLTAGPDAQFADYRSDHRRDVLALRRMNLTCVHDAERQHLDRFIEIYLDTMRRVGADADYFFDRSYFEELTARLGDHVHLFVCVLDGKVISGGLVTTCQDIVQGHLSGADSSYRKLASNKFLIDEIRSWATARGCRCFHLGGGVGAQRDSLFDFKAGFSNRRHDFSTWRWVLEPDVYVALGEEKSRWNAAAGLATPPTSYFPAYRASATTLVPARKAGNFRTLTTADDDEWQAVLDRTSQHDFYHRAGYHRLAESQGEGIARLFVYEEGEHVAALPLLLREVECSSGQGWNDATSVYGYGGPVTSGPALPEPMLRRFHEALRQRMIEERIVSVFSRLHPLIPQREIVAGLGDVCPAGRTVSIDLTISPAAQRAQYSASYRTRINKLRRQGGTCTLDEAQRHLGAFVEIYHDTMRRVNAHGSYFFSTDYFHQLSRELGGGLKLFVAELDGQVIGASLFTLCRGAVQYHLGATASAFLRHSPLSLIIDTAREWAVSQGARVLHLGGGVGSKEDSLFTYKAGFSDSRHRFETWRWITEPEAYARLSEERQRANAQLGVEAASGDYFPAYRCPTVSLSERLALEGAQTLTENA